MDVAGEALIIPRPVLVELAGRDWRIPALPAATWILILLERNLADIVPGMVEGGDLGELYDLIAAGQVTGADCEAAARDVITAVAGCPWYAAVRLLHSAARDPAAMGELRMSGIDPVVAPLGAALVALYRIYTRDKERKDVAKIDAELAKAPPGMSAIDTRYDPTAAADAFESMFAARGGR